MQRRQFVSPLLTEETTSTDDHTCRVCGLTIASGEPLLFRAWHIEWSHLACGWIRPDEIEPHQRTKPGTFQSYWEWRCPTCHRDACSVRTPDAETERQCSRCAPDQYVITNGVRVEIVAGVRVWKGKRSLVIPARSRAYVRELKEGSGLIGSVALLEWIGVKAPRCFVELTKLVRV